MKIVTLVENTASGNCLACEHGLSLYVECSGYKILFDMGQSDAFARNAKALNIDLSQVDIAVLSHGHYDHGGGVETFLRINAKAPVYVHEKVLGNYYNAQGKYIGLDPKLAAEPRVIRTAGELQLAPGIFLTDCSKESWRFDPHGLQKELGGVRMPDDFAHEQYLQIREGEKRIVFSGCSHRGIGNIATAFAVDFLIGGFHLNKVEDPNLLRSVGKTLCDTGTVFYTGHCTGSAQFAALKEYMGENLQAISTGTVIEL